MNINIIETSLTFGSLSRRSATRRIILHHAAAISCGASTIHKWHKANGWAGIGYHFVVRKSGTIERGRPEWALGAHASGSNSDSIGICFEGDFTSEQMNDTQQTAGQQLISWIKSKYGISKVQKHSDVCSTSCPGKNFPFGTIANSAAKPSSGQASPPSTPSKNPASDWISRLQSECNRQGFSHQAIDGIAGKNTLAGCPTLYPGASGQITKLMQERLISLGYNCGSYGSDGIFGIETQKAVKVFQKANGLSADGIVGPATWRKLLHMV